MLQSSRVATQMSKPVLRSILAFIGLLFLLGLLETQPADARRRNSDAERQAWSAVDILNPDSISDFLESFPSGEYSQEAKEYQEINVYISSIKSGDEEPKFAIPFTTLKDWGWWHSLVRPTVVGYYIYTFPGGHGEGLTSYPSLNGKTIEFMSGSAMSFDASFSVGDPFLEFNVFDPSTAVSMVSVATPVGSIIGFETDGLDLSIYGMHFISKEDGRLLFAAIDGIGLVHVQGAGTVIMPDGTSEVLEEPLTDN